MCTKRKWGLTLTSSLPIGVELYDSSEAEDGQLILSVSGGPKSGKTFLSTHVDRPLYYLMLDPHDNVRRALRHADEDGYTGPVYLKTIRPVRYDDLTDDKAQKILDEIEDFASWARTEARKAKAAGLPTGTFVLDGAKRFKGYVEKAKLGQSITLGWRPTKGGSSISRFEYAEANTYIVDFLAAFLGSPLDVIMTTEGQRKWVGNDRTEEFRSGSIDNLGFVVHAEVVTLMDKEAIIVDQRVQGYRSVPKVRIVFNDAQPYLNDRVMKAQSFNKLKELFGITNPVEAEDRLDPSDAKHEPALVDPFGVKDDDE